MQRKIEKINKAIHITIKNTKTYYILGVIKMKIIIDKLTNNKIVDKIKELKEALEKNDIEDIKKKTDSLNEVAMKLATKVYEEAAKENQNNQENTTNSEKKDDKSDVEEANYEEK